MPEITEQQRQILETISAGGPRHTGRANYRDYYHGKHATMLTERQRKYLQVKTGQEFNDNYCRIVVEALTERLSITSFTVADDDAAQRLISEWWSANRLDAGQSDIHTAGVRDGDSYILTEWDNDAGRPDITFEPAYDGSEGAEVVYDPNRRRRALYGFKRWKAGDGERLNVYYPERVEKFTRAGDGDWMLETVAMYGAVLGVPLFHIRNRSDGYNYGESELADVIPIQNALNKSIIDLVAAADTTGFRLYWMTGGDPSELEVTPGGWIYNDSPEARIGHIPGEDLSKLIEFKDAFATEIARVSRTPLSYFQITRQVASEGTLKQQESGLVSRAKKRQVEFGNTWEDVFGYCRKLHNLYSGNPILDEAATIDVQWADPETRDDRGRLEELKLKRELGVPDRIIWAEMGYSAEQIAEFEASPDYQERQARRKLLNVRLSQEDEIPEFDQ